MFNRIERQVLESLAQGGEVVRSTYAPNMSIWWLRPAHGSPVQVRLQTLLRLMQRGYVIPIRNADRQVVKYIFPREKKLPALLL